MGSPPQPPLPLHPSILSDQQDRDKPGQWGLLYVDDIKFPVSIDDTELRRRHRVSCLTKIHRRSEQRSPIGKFPSSSCCRSVSLPQAFSRPLPAVLSLSPSRSVDLSSSDYIVLRWPHLRQIHHATLSDCRRVREIPVFGLYPSRVGIQNTLQGRFAANAAARKTIASRQVQKWPGMLPARNFSLAEVTETHENASDEGL